MRPRGWGVAAGAAACLVLLGIGLAGCRSDGGPPPPAVPPPPAPPPPPLPEVEVGFAASGLDLSEGESGVVEIRYRGRRLTAPWEFRIALAEGAAPPEDFRLPEETFVVPAGGEGEEVSGTASFTVEALADLRFAEGEQVFLLEPVPLRARDGVRLLAEEPFPVRVADAGVSPCPGVTLKALPWTLAEPSSRRDPEPMPATTLTIELVGLGLGTTFDLVGPYALLDPDSGQVQPWGAFGINRWRLEEVSGGVRHRLDVNWPGEAAFAEERDLEFAFTGGACAGTPAASCTSTTCELEETAPGMDRSSRRN